MKILYIIMLGCLGLLSAQTPISLEEAYEKALENNPEIRQKNLQSDYMNSLENTVKDIDPLGLAVDLGQMNSAYFDNGISVEQSFKFPGFYQSQKRVKTEEWKQTMMNVELSKHLLKKELALAYNQLNYLDEKQGLLLLADSIYSEYYRLASLRVQQGESSILEQTTAENYQAKAKIQLSNLQYDKNWALFQFNYLIAGDEVYTAQFNDYYQNYSENLADFTINELMLQTFQQELEISNARIEAEKAKKKPSFALLYNNVTQYGTGANDRFYDYSKRFSSGAIGISLPIFNKSINAKIESEKRNQEMLQSSIELQQRKYTKEMEYYQMQILKISKEQSYYTQDGLNNSKQILSTANRLYYEGEINYLEWAILVNQSLEIQNTYIENQKVLNENIISLNNLQSEN